MEKKEKLQIRISEDLKKKAVIKAKTENRTLSNYVINLIEKDLKEEKANEIVKTKSKR